MGSQGRFSTELYREILHYFQPNDEMDLKTCKRFLANLALVCRNFASLAKGYMFKKMNFEWEEDAAHLEFCRLLNAGQPSAVAAASRICECTIAFSKREFKSAFVNRDFMVYSVALSKMPRLVTLHTSTIPASVLVFEAAYTSKTLKRLSINGPNIWIVQQVLQKSYVTELDLFTGGGQPAEGVWTHFLLPKTVRIFRTDIWALGHRLLTLRPVLVLDILELHRVSPDIDPNTLLEYLHLNHSILQLRVDIPSTATLYKNHLQPPVLPFLRVLQCDLSLAVILVSCAPRLEKLIIRPPQQVIPMPQISLVSPPSTLSIRSMTVFHDLSLNMSFGTDYPNLISLCIDLTKLACVPRPKAQTQPEAIIRSLFRPQFWAIRNKLRELHFIVNESNGAWNTYFFFDYDGKRQRSLLEYLSNYFTRLVKVTFLLQVKWERELEDASWRFRVVQ
ncbi:hypothetical protein C8J56DRAFT_910381 [Mycena floridula]|nr:hypothetical protein C8J56DRAFT_910381 [Mycena floridula]